MIDVRLPRWLGLDFKEKGRIRPSELQLKLECPGVSEAQVTLPRGAPVPAMHEWLEIYTARGSAGFFRITNTVKTFTGETTLTLRHAVDTFADSYFDTQGDYEGTVADYMADIIAAQTARLGGSAPWQLGVVVNGTTSYPVKVNYDRLSDALSSLLENLPGTQLAYDFTTSPWTISLIAQPAGVASEFRLGHNLSTLEVTYSDADLCTQLVLQVNAVDVESSTGMPDIVTPVQVTKTYNNATAQAYWGVVQQYAAIDTHDDLTQQTLPEADAWAANYLAKRAEPFVQIEIDGDELAAYTFENYDETHLGQLCRVALPDYDAFFSERVVSITYPDVLGSPTHVTVSLANEVIKASGALKATAKTAKVAAAAAASAGRQANAAAGLSHWEAIVQDIKLADDATGITELYESGIVLDAQEGVTIYSLAQGFRSDYSAIKVNTEQIALRVRNGQVATQLAVECGNVSISGGNLVVSGYVQSSSLESEIAAISEINLHDLVANEAGITTLMATTLTVLGNTSLGSVTVNGTDLESNAVSSIGPATVDSNTGGVSIPWSYLSGSPGTPVTFNIASTVYFQQAVAAAAAAVTVSGSWATNMFTASASNGQGAVGSFTVGDITSTSVNPNDGHYLTGTVPITLVGGGSTSYTPTVNINATPSYNAGASSVTLSGSWDASTRTYTVTASNGQTVSTTLGVTYVYPRGNSVTLSNYTRTSVDTCGTSHRVPLTLSGPHTIVDEDGYVWRNMYYCSNWDTLYEKKTSYYFDDDGTESTYYQGASRQTYYTIPS